MLGIDLYLLIVSESAGNDEGWRGGGLKKHCAEIRKKRSVIARAHRLPRRSCVRALRSPLAPSAAAAAAALLRQATPRPVRLTSYITLAIARITGIGSRLKTG